MSLLKNFSVVSGATLLSRLLGLVRDILFFATFGTSLIGEAFLLAFTLPNLFRRMLGEGTLSSAFIPVFANLQNSDPEKGQWQLLNQVLSRLLLSLGVLSTAVGLACWFAYDSNLFQLKKWQDAVLLNGITFFYVIFICGSAILVGALNVKKSFWAGAFSPVVLNLFMICALFFSGFVYGLSFTFCAVILAISVVLAGVFQFCLPWFELRKRFKWNWKHDFSSSVQLCEVGSLFWIGVFGAAVVQINILVSRSLAYLLEEQGPVSYLYMSARLVELPLGIFAIALSTILFPRLSKAMGEGNLMDYKNSFFSGLRIISMLTVPSAIGLFILGDLVIKTLFQWKEFGGENVYMASKVMSVVAWTIPLYALSTFLVKSFHSQKNMNVPLKAASISLLVNVFASLLLMNEHGVIGLAWANLVAAIFQLVYLSLKNPHVTWKSFISAEGLCLPKVLLSSFCMYCIVAYSKQFTEFGVSKFAVMAQLALVVTLGILSYFIFLVLLNFPLRDGKPLRFKTNQK